MGPQNLFTYQNLQDLMRKPARVVSKTTNEAIFLEVTTKNLAPAVFFVVFLIDPTL